MLQANADLKRLSRTILQDTLEVGRRRGRQRKCWMNKVKEWTSLPMPVMLTVPPAGKVGRGPLLNRPSCPSDNPTAQDLVS